MTKLNENALETARMAGKVSTPIAEDIIEAYLAALQPTDAGGEPLDVEEIDVAERIMEGREHSADTVAVPRSELLVLAGKVSGVLTPVKMSAVVAWAQRKLDLSAASPEAGPTPDWNYLAAVLEKHMDAFPGPEFIRPFVPALRALTEAKPLELETTAQAIYEHWQFGADDLPRTEPKPPWVPNGNSYKQESARTFARVVLAALASPTVETPDPAKLSRWQPMAQPKPETPDDPHGYMVRVPEGEYVRWADLLEMLKLNRRPN